ncbi:MAG TPA: DNA-formamidopyrimidine glycosylase family protein [Flavisolibacter sp.]|nr:DNA-formamidopyrimidine glycosylase family protein [Flavisolibacter sp.]
MPELPDIEVFSRNLKKLLAGKQVAKVKVINGKKLKDTAKELSQALEGQKILDVYRSGKELRIQFSKKVLLGVHLMLTGDLHFLEGSNERKSTIVELQFNDGTSLALTDRMKNAAVKLAPVDKAGIDALEIPYKSLKEILNRKAAIKNVLLDQDLIRGIGNGYSDEILWETRISPFSKAAAIPDEKIKELATTIKKVLKKATEKIYKAYPGKINGEVKEFLQIHTKKKTESPAGRPILTAERGMLKTYYTDEQVMYE